MIGGTISGGASEPRARVNIVIPFASGQFTHHFVWWLGPILGRNCAGLAYDKIFEEKRGKP